MTDTERERINAICEVAGVTEIDDLSDGFHTLQTSELSKWQAERIRQINDRCFLQGQ